MFKRSKKKSPSAKDIAALAKKENSNISSQSYSSLPKSLYTGRENETGPQHMPHSRSTTNSKEFYHQQSSSSTQDVRLNSPLDLPMEALQSISAAYNLGQHGYSNDNMTSASMSSLTNKQPPNRSPYQSPVHTSGLANMKTNTRHRSLEKGEYSGMFSGDPSLERQFERLHMIMPGNGGEIECTSNTLPARDRRSASQSYGRDRSLEREQYPHMGARSLEREHYYHPGSRSRQNDHDRQEYTSQLAQTQEQFRNLNRDSLILELQSQITDLNKDCAKLQQEVDSTKDKLSSTMNSIKTFWSPELKKERSLRKEESAKYSLMNEQLKVAQAEVKKLNGTLRDLEKSSKDATSRSPVSSQEHDHVKRDLENQTKEIRILRKTVGEMELRLETQKQTLSARDGSIKKLLEMLQSKGLAADTFEQSQKELEEVRVQRSEDQKQLAQLKENMEQLNGEISSLKESNGQLTDELTQAQVQLKQQPASTHTMQAIMEAKDSRISAMEKEVQSLEDRLHRFGEEGTPDKDSGSLKDRIPGKEKVLRVEIECLKGELSSKDNEIVGQKMKSETLQKQQSEHQHYINVLKEQISAKEQQSAMFQADIDDLRERLKEKDNNIDKKSRQSQTLQVEKRKLEVEVAELKDHIDIKERKINVLQRKIENLEDLVNEKEDLLSQARARISTNSIESNDSAISNMEESLYEKEKQILRLKEQRELTELEHQEECETLLKVNQELKSQVDILQLDITDKQTELCELREEVSELKSSQYKADSKVRQLELSICEKDTDFGRLTERLEQIEASAGTKSDGSGMTESQLTDLVEKVEKCEGEMKTAQSEVDRLLTILKEMENEKNDKEKHTTELQDTVSQYKQKFGTLKRIQQTDRKKNAHLLEEARRREEDVLGDSMQLKGSVKEKEGRIEELEEALRESVRITAEREMVMMEQKMQIDAAQSKVEELKNDLAKANGFGKEHGAKLAHYVKQLEEKDHKLRRLQSERHKHLEEVYEMKQDAIQAAISEKDANIALLEMTSSKKQRNTEDIERLNKEKEKLQEHLRELTQNRMKLLHKEERKNKRSSSAHKSRSSSAGPTPRTEPVSEDITAQPPVQQQTTPEPVVQDS